MAKQPVTSHGGLIAWEPSSVFLAPWQSNNNKVTLSYREVFSEELLPCTCKVQVYKCHLGGIRRSSQQTYYLYRGLTLLPIPSASLVKGDGLTGEQFFALCFLPACAALPNSGRSNKGATQTAGTPLARRRRRHDKAVVNKPRSEPPSHKSDKRPMMQRMWLFPLFNYAGHYSPGCEHAHAHVHKGSRILRSEALVPN